MTIKWFAGAFLLVVAAGGLYLMQDPPHAIRIDRRVYMERSILDEGVEIGPAQHASIPFTWSYLLRMPSVPPTPDGDVEEERFHKMTITVSEGGTANVWLQVGTPGALEQALRPGTSSGDSVEGFYRIGIEGTVTLSGYLDYGPYVIVLKNDRELAPIQVRVRLIRGYWATPRGQ